MLNVNPGLTPWILWMLLPMASLSADDGLKVGDKAPDFEVATFGEKTVKLSERFGEKGKTTVLLFSRANW